MPYATNGTARLFWEETGAGSPLLLVMGHTYSSAMWYLVRDELAQQHRVITFDNRGTGKSSLMRKLSVGDMAADAFAVMEAAGVDSAHLYGVSMGGGIILEMARQHPERVRSLILGCTRAKTPDLPPAPLVLRALLRLPGPVITWMLKRMAAKKTTHGYGTKAPLDRVERDRAVLAANDCHVRSKVAQSRAIANYSITEAEVRALSMPTLVLHGDEDEAVPYDAGVALHQLIAHSELVTFPGAGHNYFIAAGDEANDVVRRFLADIDSNDAAQVGTPR